MKTHISFLAFLFFFSLGLAFSSNAFASCDDMGSDEWNNLSTSMALAYDQKNFDEALVYGKQLTLICNKSPIVNFTMSEIYRNLDNEEESYAYVKRATEYITDYPVPYILAEKMWMRRAELELPYKRQLEDLQNQITTGSGEIGGQMANLKTDLSMSERRLELEQNRLNELYIDDISHFNTVKWIGAGTAFGGLLLTGIGIGVFSANYKSARDNYKNDWESFDKKDAKVHGGIALMASGLGMGLVGSAVAIYGFLKERDLSQQYDNYLNNESENNGDNSTAYQFNVDVSFGSVAVGVTF